MKNVTAIILAAGKGTRMKSKNKNKVALLVKGKTMLERTLDILGECGIGNIIVVVGFAKDSIIKLLNDKVIVVEQKKRLGTGHAVKVALPKVPKDSDKVLILYGDDAFLHDSKTYKDLYQTHHNKKAKVSFITMDMQNPTGYGRIKRDSKDNVVGIVEEKNASIDEKKIKEINLGCYLLDKSYLEENIDKISKNFITGEYYITDIIDIISKNKDKIAVYKIENKGWRGVNTKEDLQVVEKTLKIN